jgi:aspartate aminotransferase
MISKKAKALKPSPTLALAAKAKELAASGRDVISLSVGEPDWDTLPSAKKAGLEAIEKGVTKYTPANGTPELRKLIAEQTSQDLKLEFKADDVTVSSGGKMVIYIALQTILDEGDEVIIPAPYWVSYPVQVELAGGKNVFVPTTLETQFKMTAAQLEKVITPKTKLLIFNSPSNPTGLMYTDKELKALAEVLKKHPHVYILSDDIYNRLVFEGELAPHLLLVAPELKDRVLVMNGASKTYSMTGWRVGWALGPQTWIKAMTNYASQSVSQAASMSQAATAAAIKNCGAELKTSLVELKKRRDMAVERMKSIPGVETLPPDGAFYLWPDIRNTFGKKYNGKSINNSSDFSALLLEEKNVAVVPGVEFGMEGYVRMSFALNEKRMIEAIDRIRDFVIALK